MPEADADRLAPHVGAGVLKPIMDGGGCRSPPAAGNLFRGCAVSVIGGMHERTTAPCQAGGPATHTLFALQNARMPWAPSSRP
jgi:hypothetical protein